MGKREKKDLIQNLLGILATFLAVCIIFGRPSGLVFEKVCFYLAFILAGMAVWLAFMWASLDREK